MLAILNLSFLGSVTCKGAQCSISGSTGRPLAGYFSNNGRSKLAAQIDSDNEDDSYMPSKASMDKDPVNRSGESNLKKDGNPSKGLSVRIDPVESTTSNTASSMPAASYDYEDEGDMGQSSINPRSLNEQTIRKKKLLTFSSISDLPHPALFK